MIDAFCFQVYLIFSQILKNYIQKNLKMPVCYMPPVPPCVIERSPWWGRWWKRLIRTIETCLKFAVGKSLHYSTIVLRITLHHEFASHMWMMMLKNVFSTYYISKYRLSPTQFLIQKTLSCTKGLEIIKNLYPRKDGKIRAYEWQYQEGTVKGDIPEIVSPGT